MNIKPVALDFLYKTTFHVEPPEAYERLIFDAMIGDQTLFIRGDEAEAAWAVIDPIEQGWAKSASTPPEQYAPGTLGPEAGDGPDRARRPPLAAQRRRRAGADHRVLVVRRANPLCRSPICVSVQGRTQGSPLTWSDASAELPQNAGSIYFRRIMARTIEHPALAPLKARFPETKFLVGEFRDMVTVVVPREAIAPVCTFLRDDPTLQLRHARRAERRRLPQLPGARHRFAVNYGLTQHRPQQPAVAQGLPRPRARHRPRRTDRPRRGGRSRRATPA